MRLRSLTRMGAALLLLGTSACGAVFPEVSTPLRAVAPGREVKPEPSAELIYLEIKEARIPERTRDGRSWGESKGSAPDPFVVVFLGDAELFRTPIESNSFTPTFKGQPSGNYRIPVGKPLQIDLLDSQATSNQPICSERVRDLHDDVMSGMQELDMRCEGGTRLVLTIGPARPRLGLGFFYELVLGKINVTRLHSESPAARAGMKPGDSILEIMGKKVNTLEDGAAQSLINANAQVGVDLVVRHKNGKVKKIKVKEGAVYPLRNEFSRQQRISE